MDILDCIRNPFGLGPEATISPLGNGHINETRLVRDGSRRLVAQRINTTVFSRPSKLVENARLIESHLAAVPGAPRVVRHLSGKDGSFLFGPQGNVRVLEYIPGTRCLEVLENPAQARRAAVSFGSFSRCMQGIDPGDLDIVIPDFHGPAIRWSQFMATLERDRAGRSGDCPEEVAFALDHERDVLGWQELMGGLPLRICHNDCKINNLLVHRDSGESIAIIDLDTCMPGRVLTDFGDLVRSCSSPEPEDSTRLERITARPPVYRALLEGYLEGWQGGLEKDERDSLLQGALMMCFILGLRFLGDFIDGDRYFSVARPWHNLERARNQFQLFRSLVKQRKMFAGLA